jgi:chaperonin cofactor prefoldin
LWANYYIVLHRDGNFILSVNIHAPFLQVVVQENFEKSKKDLNGKITSLTSQIDSLNTQLQKEKVKSKINHIHSNLY